jgi:lactoylglutathione lyase
VTTEFVIYEGRNSNIVGIRYGQIYKNILELPIKTKSSDWVEFFARDTTLALHPLKSKRKNIKSKPSSGGALVGFMVSDLESTARTLKEKNVKFFKELKNESFGKHAHRTIVTSFKISK